MVHIVILLSKDVYTKKSVAQICTCMKLMRFLRFVVAYFLIITVSRFPLFYCESK